MYFSRSIVLVSVCVFLLGSAAYGQDDDDDCDPAQLLLDLQTSATTLLGVWSDVLAALPGVGDGITNALTDIVSSPNAQDGLGDMMATFQDLMDNGDDLKSIVSQLVNKLQDLAQQGLLNPQLLQQLTELQDIQPIVLAVLGNMGQSLNDMATSGLSTLGGMQGDLTDLGSQVLETLDGIKDVAIGPDVQAELKTMLNKAISLCDALLDQQLGALSTMDLLGILGGLDLSGALGGMDLSGALGGMDVSGIVDSVSGALGGMNLSGMADSVSGLLN